MYQIAHLDHFAESKCTNWLTNLMKIWAKIAEHASKLRNGDMSRNLVWFGVKFLCMCELFCKEGSLRSTTANRTMNMTSGKYQDQKLRTAYRGDLSTFCSTSVINQMKWFLCIKFIPMSMQSWSGCLKWKGLPLSQTAKSKQFYSH